MAAPKTIPILALASPDDQPSIAKAGELMAEALSGEAGRSWAVTCDAIGPDEAAAAAGPAILVISWTSEVDRFAEPWRMTETRLRTQIAAFCETPQLTVFLCTVFRHVARDGSADEIEKKRLRIRRLNFLALELSRELGVMIADLDRDLTDVGGRAFNTDYRLRGAHAPAAAGKSIALALLHVGLDDFAPFDLQEAARDRLRAYQPPQTTAPAPIPLKLGGTVGAVRSKHRVHVVEYNARPADEAVVAGHFKRLLNGKIGLGEAVNLMAGSVASRGFKQSFARLFKGLRKAASETHQAQP